MPGLEPIVNGLRKEARPPRRFLTAGGSAAVAIVLVLFGIVIGQNIVGTWPSAPPVTVRVSLADTTAGDGALTVAQVDSLESRLAEAAADSLRARAAAEDTVDLYVLRRVASRTGVAWEFRLLLITLCFGALGSWVHAVSSYVRFAGNRQLVASWTMWYAMRPFLGAGLAVIFYVVVRAGFATSAGSDLNALSPYTVAAFAGLVGLFTEQATKKLKDVFDALFSPRGRDRDADPLGEAVSEGAPEIESVSPRWIETGRTPVEVTVKGRNFTEDATVTVDGAPVPAEEVGRAGEGELSFNLDPGARAAKGSVEVVVRTGAGASRARRITVTPGVAESADSPPNG